MRSAHRDAGRVGGWGAGLLLLCLLAGRSGLAAPQRAHKPARTGKAAASAADRALGAASAQASPEEDDAGDAAQAHGSGGPRPPRTLGRSPPRQPEQVTSFWLAVAKAQVGRKQPAPARRAFARALALAPPNRAAIHDLLWFLVEQPDQAALMRALAHFAATAAGDAQLWRGYAAGLCRLGRYTQALPWFARGARQTAGSAGTSEPRLWLADWVQALARSGRSRQAERVRAQALRELQQMMKSPSRGTASAASTRLAALTFDKLLRWQFDREFLAGRSARLRPPAESAAQVDAAPDESGPESEEEEGATADVADGADAALDDVPAADAPEADDSDEDDEPTATAVSPPSLQRPHRLSAAAGYELHSLGGLLIHSTLASVAVMLRPLELGLRAGYSYLDTANERIGFSDPGLASGEFDVAAFVRFRPSAGFFEALVGGNLRRELSIPYAAARGLYYFGHGISLLAEVALNQLTEDTLGLRVLGARDRVLAGLTLEPLRWLYVSTELDWHGFRSRSREALGDGFAAYLETGYRARSGPLAWDARVSGFYEHNRLPDELPAALCDRLKDSCDSTGIDDIVLPSYGMVGGGPRLRYGMPGTTASGGGSGRFFAFLDIWLGALLHTDPSSGSNAITSSVGYDLQLGLGAQLPRTMGRLSASGYASNSRSGGFEGIQWGVGIRYTH